MSKKSRFYLKWDKIPFGKKKNPVTIAVGAFGEPGIDIWIKDKCLFLNLEQTLELYKMLKFSYAHLVGDEKSEDT